MTRIQDAAQALHQDWQTKAPFENIAQGFGVTSAEQAYDVQAALQKLHVPSRGAIVGRKIALASKVMQQMIGFDQPISGAIFASDVMQSPANVSADAFGRLGVECELAVEIERGRRAAAHGFHSGQRGRADRHGPACFRVDRGPQG